MAGVEGVSTETRMKILRLHRKHDGRHGPGRVHARGGLAPEPAGHVPAAGKAAREDAHGQEAGEGQRISRTGRSGPAVELPASGAAPGTGKRSSDPCRFTSSSASNRFPTRNDSTVSPWIPHGGHQPRGHPAGHQSRRPPCRRGGPAHPGGSRGLGDRPDHGSAPGEKVPGGCTGHGRRPGGAALRHGLRRR